MGKLYNLARVNCTTVGTGALTLTTAVPGYLTFVLAGAASGDIVDYAIKDGVNSEIGYGVYTVAGGPTYTLTRNVIKSTNSNSPLNLSGAAEVAITPSAETLNTETNRQNNFLSWIYQSKLLGDVRRGVNLWATGFKAGNDTLRGINTGVSSNVDVSAAAASGYVAPSLTSTQVTIAVQTSTSANSTQFTEFLLGTALIPGVTISSVGYSTTAALNNIKIKIGKRNSAGNYDIVADTGSINHPGGGFVDFPLNYTVPGSGSYYIGTYIPGGIPSGGAGFGASGSRAFKTNSDATGAGVTGFTEDTGATLPLRYAHSETINNMTLVTTSQAADAPVSNVRALLEYDNVDAPTLNTDLIMDVSCKLEAATVTISNASPGVVTHAAHGMSALDPVAFATTGALPAGLVAGTTYFVVASGLTSGTYSVSATPGGAAINTSSAGSGTHTASYRNWTAATLSVVTSNSQGARTVAETADTSCAAGTSFTVRIKTLTNKNVPIYGTSLMVR